MGLIIKGTYDHVELILSVSGLLTSVAGNFCASRSSGTVSDEAQTEREKNTAFMQKEIQWIHQHKDDSYRLSMFHMFVCVHWT